MASLSDLHKSISQILPDYEIDVQEDFEHAAVSFTIKNGSTAYKLKVADQYIENMAPEKLIEDLEENNFITRMINAGSHPMILDDSGLKYLE
ncbi:MAG: hypothetical protein D6B27_11785 [Gammaproteobacteria bacterium]|nr:MAG: hypothetical protein D6B27_11785 [Gammaproteobacteria bacterium]